MSNGNYLDNIKNKCKIYNSDSFTINLSDDEIENNKFEKIDDKFYLEYVENNSLLRKRNETKDNTWEQTITIMVSLKMTIFISYLFLRAFI